MQETGMWVEAAGDYRADCVGEEEAITEVERGVHGVFRGPAGAGVELYPLAFADRRAEHGLETTEVPGGGDSLDAEQFRERPGCSCFCLQVPHLPHDVRHVAVAAQQRGVVADLRVDELARKVKAPAGGEHVLAHPGASVRRHCR